MYLVFRFSLHGDKKSRLVEGFSYAQHAQSLHAGILRSICACVLSFRGRLSIEPCFEAPCVPTTADFSRTARVALIGLSPSGYPLGHRFHRSCLFGVTDEGHMANFVRGVPNRLLGRSVLVGGIGKKKRSNRQGRRGIVGVCVGFLADFFLCATDHPWAPGRHASQVEQR